MARYVQKNTTARRRGAPEPVGPEGPLAARPTASTGPLAAESEGGRVRFGRQDIGAELLPILTTGLYKNTFDALREYIQNAIDALAPSIEIAINEDVITIVDTGQGMTREVARNAIRLGVSDKNPERNVGFRGIGIYSGFNLCNRLEIFTRAVGDATWHISFDFERIRVALLAEQARRTAGLEPDLSLERLLTETVSVGEAEEEPISNYGTLVLLTGLLSEVYRELNDWGKVQDYLQNVVPLPLDPEFRYAPEITERLERVGERTINLTLAIGEQRSPVHRPYRDEIFDRGGLHPPLFIDVGPPSKPFGVAWVCVNDRRRTIKDEKVRGILIKKFGFSVADRRYLEPYFGRTLYSRRVTGEIIVTHPQLIPNAARSDFESNATRQAFLEYLPRFTRDVDRWADEIQDTEKALEVLFGVRERVTKINAELPGLQRDREELLRLNPSVDAFRKELRPHLKRLAKLQPEALAETQELLDGVQGFIREALISQRRVRQQLESEVIRSVQRDADAATSPPSTVVPEAPPRALLEVLDDFVPGIAPEARRALAYFDESILRSALSADAYTAALMDLRIYLEQEL